MTILVDADGVTVTRSDRTLFSELSVTVSDRDRLGVVGINGTGKSTLLRVLSGRAEPDGGQVRRGRGVRVGVLDQEAALPAGSVRQAVGGGWESEAILDRLGMASRSTVTSPSSPAVRPSGWRWPPCCPHRPRC